MKQRSRVIVMLAIASIALIFNGDRLLGRINTLSSSVSSQATATSQPLAPASPPNVETASTATASMPSTPESSEDESIQDAAESETSPLYRVSSVVDGDTLDITTPENSVIRVRLIGVDTPETVDPRKPVQCFGREASDKTKQLALGQSVRLEADTTQGDKDKYDRLLRYVFIGDSFLNQVLIADGYAHEYTYAVPYRYQSVFRQAQKEASAALVGLWAPDACGSVATNKDCAIKGNISADEEKIYHVPGGEYYSKTTITESKGERWFCSEAQALEAGWRKSLL